MLEVNDDDNMSDSNDDYIHFQYTPYLKKMESLKKINK